MQTSSARHLPLASVLVPPGLDGTSLEAAAWPQALRRRLGRNWWLKAIGTSAFMAVFFAFYLHLLAAPVFTPALMPLTMVDHWIAFTPLALGWYASLWLYVTLPPALIAGRVELVLYGVWIGLLCALGLTIFYFWPTLTPVPPDIDWADYPGFDVLKGVDAPGNACPSLHVATAFFSGYWLHVLLGRLGLGRKILAGNWLWCLAIIYSTLATKQHVFVDVLAGLVLGGLFILISRRFPLD